jgi:hypothetical protein
MLCVMCVRSLRGAVSRVRRVLAGVRMTSVRVTGMSVAGVGRVSTARTMTAVSDVPELGEPSHRHRGESSAAESEAEAIEIHTPNTTCWRGGW